MDPLAPLITALHSHGRLRVWSMIITVFGDLVQHRGGQISMARLGSVLGRVGVEKGALRTALSRLGRDGWVQSERVGRTSLYRLSEQGLARFVPATTRIYAPPRSTPITRWAIALRSGAGARQDARLCPADEVEGGADCLVVGSLQEISQAYRASLLSPGHRHALEALAVDIEVLSQPGTFEPLEAAAARVLLVHRWRRLVLRFPEVPAELMPRDAPLRDPRRRVAEVYAHLSPATETWLSNEFGGLPAMPAVAGAQPGRFANP